MSRPKGCRHTPETIARFRAMRAPQTLDLYRSKVRQGDPEECWPWLGTVRADGYGKLTAGRGQQYLAHRYGWALVNGPIPSGLVLDHECHNRASDCVGVCEHRKCQNPAHLRPVSRRDNVLAGRTIAAAFAKRTHCKRGHELNESRICRECRRLTQSRWRANP